MSERPMPAWVACAQRHDPTDRNVFSIERVRLALIRKLCGLMQRAKDTAPTPIAKRRWEAALRAVILALDAEDRVAKCGRISPDLPIWSDLG